ncbi:MAG: hypothetical protein CL918_01820 [Deltaproteobacteria bacterium]|nr:hypothetical protein [Deltaproteobacteria bacterium]
MASCEGRDQMKIKLAEFAKIKNISPQAVRKAIKHGRLVQSISKERGGYLIDTDIAEREWSQNTNLSQVRSAQDINRNRGPAVPSNGSIPDYSEARAYAEQYKANLLELEFKEKAGELVKVEEVKKATYRTNRVFRDAVLNIPIRVISEISAIVGNLSKEKQHEMLQIMKREINDSLEHLAETDGPSS